MMSNFSTTTIAAHQAAMNFASLLYMTPLSLAMAMTIAVDLKLERNDIITQNSMDLSGLISTGIRPIVFHSSLLL